MNNNKNPENVNPIYYGKTPGYYGRHADLDDLPALMELEKEWPESSRASYDQLKFRIEKFRQGYFVAFDKTGMIASIICCPYQYQPDNLSNFKNWQSVASSCYEGDFTNTNSLYIVAGTCKPTLHYGHVFDLGIWGVLNLAKEMGKKYVVAGCLLPGYARYKQKYGEISAVDYVFTQTKEKLADPLIEKYRKHGFQVPNKEHVIENYYQDETSCNYSALVVCTI